MKCNSMGVHNCVHSTLSLQFIQSPELDADIDMLQLNKTNKKRHSLLKLKKKNLKWLYLLFMKTLYKACC